MVDLRAFGQSFQSGMLAFELLEHLKLDVAAGCKRKDVHNRLYGDGIVPRRALPDVEGKLVEQALESQERANALVQGLFVCEKIGHGRFVP